MQVIELGCGNMSEINWLSQSEQEKASAAMASVRRDEDPTDWMYIIFAGTSGPSSQQLKVCESFSCRTTTTAKILSFQRTCLFLLTSQFGGSGTGGIDALKANFPDNQICFALASMADKIDDSVTVKFIWINWLGSSVGTMMKARLSTQIGAVKEFMGVSISSCKLKSKLLTSCSNPTLPTPVTFKVKSLLPSSERKLCPPVVLVPKSLMNPLE